MVFIGNDLVGQGFFFHFLLFLGPFDPDPIPFRFFGFDEGFFLLAREKAAEEFLEMVVLFLVGQTYAVALQVVQVVGVLVG